MTLVVSCHPSGVLDVTVYEARLNDLMPRYRQVSLCLYDIGACSSEMVFQLLRTHPKVLLNATIIPNPYYVPPTAYLDAAENV